MRFRYDGPAESLPPHRRFDSETGQDALLDRTQRREFLRLVYRGLGYRTACARLGIEYKAFRRTATGSSRFRRALRHIERLKAENLLNVLYQAALEGDLIAAQYLLARQDRLLSRRPSTNPGIN